MTVGARHLQEFSGKIALVGVRIMTLVLQSDIFFATFLSTFGFSLRAKDPLGGRYARHQIMGSVRCGGIGAHAFSNRPRGRRSRLASDTESQLGCSRDADASRFAEKSRQYVCPAEFGLGLR